MVRKFKPDTQTQTGQPYGERQATAQAVEAAPMGNRDDDLDMLSQAAQQMPFTPVGMGPASPVEARNFPETAGLPFGPGPGPDGIAVDRIPPRGPSDQDVRVAGMLPLLERLAAAPGASSTMRRMVRTLRSETVQTRRAIRKVA